MNKILPSLSMQFNSAQWTPTDIKRTNCYGYALNMPGLWVNPGCLNDPKHLPSIMKGYKDLAEAESLKELLIKDGLLPVANENSAPIEGHIIVAFGGTYYESPFLRDPLTGEVITSHLHDSYYHSYHVYRRDEDGTYSDKYADLPIVRRSHESDKLRLNDLKDHYHATLEGLKYERITITNAGLFQVPREGLPIADYYMANHIK